MFSFTLATFLSILGTAMLSDHEANSLADRGDLGGAVIADAEYRVSSSLMIDWQGTVLTEGQGQRARLLPRDSIAEFDGVALWFSPTERIDESVSEGTGRLLLVNATDEPRYFLSVFVRLDLQVLDPAQGWRSIVTTLDGYCGVGISHVALRPDHHWIFTPRIDYGSLPVRMRFRLLCRRPFYQLSATTFFDTIYSNHFVGSVEAEWFDITG